ncbi:hypothetical protein [Arthrobacter sp. UYCo732]|uniref:hypothetical protein n=1 Tax=Arthrobacter sp. UYCo732 TaxID=3156336 RepID=UPI0033918FA2
MGRQDNSSQRSTASASGSRTGSGAPRTPSPAVYRRRRLFVGIALLIVVGLAFSVFAAAGAFNGTEKASSTAASPDATGEAPVPSGSPSALPSNTPTPTPTPTPTCNQNLVTVSASTDKAAYGPDQKPLLSLKVTNGGTTPCEVNIGTSQMEFLVTSGADRIFSSKDCQAKSEDLVKTIAPGASETANFPWAMNRTLEGCKPIEAKPGGGGAYYIYTAKLGSKASPKAVFQLN